MGVDIKVNTILLGGLISALQSFATEFVRDDESYIKEMSMQNLNLSYRMIEDLLFIGICSNEANIKHSQLILEYLILVFLSKYRKILKYNPNPDISEFEAFDEFFLRYCKSKEKELKKWLQKEFESGNLLEGVLNQMINYFPAKELVKLNKNKLIVIGDTLIAVRFDIENHEENQIIEELKSKTTKVFGAQLFDSIVNKVKERLIK